MKNLLKYERHTPVMRSFVHYSKTAAAVFLIFISIAFTTAMSVKAYRVRFFEFVTTVWEELTSIVIGSEDNASHDVLSPIAPTSLMDSIKSKTGYQTTRSIGNTTPIGYVSNGAFVTVTVTAASKNADNLTIQNITEGFTDFISPINMNPNSCE